MGEPWNDPGALARKLAPAVYRLAYARTGSRTDAEDVMQEVFLRLIKAKPEFASEAHAKAWLLKVASNCVGDLFRLPWRKREEPLETDMAAPEAPDMGSVTQAVLSLPAKYRIPIHLYYYRGVLRGGDRADHRQKRGDHQIPFISGPRPAAGQAEGGELC